MNDRFKVKKLAYPSLPWLGMFLCIKWYGTGLAGWSYWWVLWPSLPDIYVILKRIGGLL